MKIQWAFFPLFCVVIAGVAGCGNGSGSSSESGNGGGSGSSGPQSLTTQVGKTDNPQVALYTLNLPKSGEVTIEFGKDTNYGLNTWTVASSDNGGAVSIFVAGMLANTTYHMRADIDYSDGTSAMDTDHTFATGALPTGMSPVMAVTTTPGLTPQPGIEMINGTSGNALGLFATDLNGNVIWTYNFPDQQPGESVQGAKLLPNGDILLAVGPTSSIPLTQAIAAGTPTAVREINLATDIVKQVTITGLNSSLAAAGYSNLTLQTFHHDVTPLANGHWLVLANTLKQVTLSGASAPTTVLGDVIIDLDTKLNPVWVWNEFDHLDVNRHPYMFPDWTHTNAVVYSPDDGNLIVSMRHQNWVVKVDYNNGAGQGDILWRLGPGGDFTLEDSSGDADTNPADWFYAQHYPSFFSPNTSGVFSLGLMDNGDDRAFSDGTNCAVQGNALCYSTVPVLQLDENAKTAKFQFHQVLSPSLYNNFGGNTDQLDNGNVEYDLCGEPTAQTTSTQIFEVTNQSTPQTVWNMQLTGTNAYRALRMPSLYPGVQWSGTNF
jgi:arylsulfate sulfotransferase